MTNLNDSDLNRVFGAGGASDVASDPELGHYQRPVQDDEKPSSGGGASGGGGTPIEDGGANQGVA